MTNKLTQPKGSVSKQLNIQTISRICGCNENEVSYIYNQLDIFNIKYLYDPISEKICISNGSGLVLSYTVSENSIMVITTIQTYYFPILDVAVNINSVDGLTKIGRGKTSLELKNYEPTYDNEYIFCDINGLDFWYYDPLDVNTPDNGYFCVVTNSGKRWKRKNSNDYIDLNWFGLKFDGELSLIWQNAIDIIHNMAISANSIYNLPYIKINGGNYTLSKNVTIAPYISTVFTKDTKIVCDNILDNTDEAAITIYSNDSINLYDNNRSASFPKCISNTSGKTKLIRNGTRSLTNPKGLYTKGATSTSHAINMRISDLEVQGAFSSGHSNTATRTWLMRFENCIFNGFYAISYLGTNTDSGERITYSNCVMSGGYGDVNTKTIYLESSGINLHLLSCSIDFTGGDVIYLSDTAKWCTICIEDSHIESWNGYLVNSVNTSNIARYITFRSTNILPTGSLGFSQSLSRKLINGQACTILFDDCFISWTVYPYDSYDSITTDTSNVIIRTKNHKDLSLGLHPFSNKNRLNKIYNFSSETVGNTLSGTTNTTTVRKYGTSFSNVTAVISSIDNSLIDTALGAGSTNVLSLTWNTGGYAYIETVEKVRVIPGFDYSFKATIVMPNLTSTMNISPAIAWYDENDTLISKTEIYYSDMKTIVNTAISSIPIYTSRANKRVACRTSIMTAPQGAAYARGVIECTNGTTGSVYYITDYNLFYSPTN